MRPCSREKERQRLGQSPSEATSVKERTLRRASGAAPIEIDQVCHFLFTLTRYTLYARQLDDRLDRFALLVQLAHFVREYPDVCVYTRPSVGGGNE